MRTVLLTLSLLLIAPPAFAVDPVEGLWNSPLAGAKVQISPCPKQPAEMCGVVSTMPPDKLDERDKHNPNHALRERPILGITAMYGFKQHAPGKWTGGRLYDPSTGKTYKGKLTASADGTLKVHGCVLMLCKSYTWSRG